MLGKNGQGNTAPVPQGTAVTLTPVSGSSTVSAISGTTDANGVASFKVTDTMPEAVQYKASALGVTVTAQPSVTFQPQTVSATASKVVASPSAGGRRRHHRVHGHGHPLRPGGDQLHHRQSTGDPDPGQRQAPVIHAVSATTNSSGVATFTVTDATPELVSLPAQAGASPSAPPPK